MTAGWTSFFFGQGAWAFWYGALLLAFLMLMVTAFYACVDPAGPGAGPMLMLMVFFLGFSIMLVMSTVDVWMWAGTAGYGVPLKAVLVIVTWIVVSTSWTWLFWATDPNYPEKLVPGRVLFTAHSVLLYAANLWLLAQVRRVKP